MTALTKQQPNGRNERGFLWIDGSCVPKLATGEPDNWQDLSTSTPGACSAAIIEKALESAVHFKAFLHMVNSFAEYHKASFAMDLDLGTAGDHERAVALLEQLRFESYASLSDFVNLLPARATA
jgi:hypothetical protein